MCSVRLRPSHQRLVNQLCVCVRVVRRDIRYLGAVGAIAIAIDTSIRFTRTTQLPGEIKCRWCVHCTRIETICWEARRRLPHTAGERTQKLPLVIIKDVKWIGIHICNCSFPFVFIFFHSLLLVDARVLYESVLYGRRHRFFHFFRTPTIFTNSLSDFD